MKTFLVDLSLLLVCLTSFPAQAQSGSRPVVATPVLTGNSRVGPRAAYAKLPLSFEPNQGQTDARVKFLSRGVGYTLFLTPDEAGLSLRSTSLELHDPLLFGATGMPGQLQEQVQTSLLQVRVVGANPQAEISGADELPGKSNYFIGNDPQKWRTGVPTYATVKYHDVYPGVDLVYYGNQEGRLEYDFIVGRGAELGNIRLAIAGRADATPLRIDANGDLVVATKSGGVRYQKPVAYQVIAESRSTNDQNKRFVEARYVLKPSNQVGFEVAAYDSTRPSATGPQTSSMGTPTRLLPS